MKGGIIKLVLLSGFVFGVGFGAATVVNKIKQTNVFVIKSVEGTPFITMVLIQRPMM